MNKWCTWWNPVIYILLSIKFKFKFKFSHIMTVRNKINRVHTNLSRKRSSTRRNLKIPAFCLSVGVKTFWKHSFISTHYTLFLHENGAFRKLPSNRRNLKTPALCLSVRVKTFSFENGHFRKRWHHDNNTISPSEVSSNTNPYWTVNVARKFSDSSRVVWTENIWFVIFVKTCRIKAAV